MDAIRKIGQDHDLPIIEDAAHAWGAKYKGRYIGSEGDVVCFSLQAIKIITCADGGIIATTSVDFYERVEKYVWYGAGREQRNPNNIDPLPDQIDALGFKYNMNDVAAAIGLAGLSHIDKALGEERDWRSI